MNWEFVVALVIAIPVILFPVALIWYLNLGSIFSRAKEAIRKKKIATEKEKEAVVTR